MRVRFKAPHFAAGPNFKRQDGLTMKGQWYPKGEHEVPEGTPLPKDAVILDESSQPVLIPKPNRNALHEHDLERAAGDSKNEALKAAEAERTKKRKPGRPKKYA